MELYFNAMGPLDWDLGSTSENKYKISSRSIGLLPFSEALPKIPSKTWKKQKYRQGQHGSSEMAQKDIRGALLYHILFSNKASFGTK